MHMARVRLDENARLLLPKEVLNALSILPGDDVFFIIHGSHVIVTTDPEDYAPYLHDGGAFGSDFPDRPSSPEDWHGWESWDEEGRR